MRNNVIWRYPFNQQYTQYKRMPNINLSGGDRGICAYYTARFLYYGLRCFDGRTAIERLKQDCIAPSLYPISEIAGSAESKVKDKQLADQAALNDGPTYGLDTLVDLNNRGSLAKLYALGSPLNDSVIGQNLMELTYSNGKNFYVSHHLINLWSQFDKRCQTLFTQTWSFKEGDEIKINLSHPNIKTDFYSDREIIFRLAYEKLSTPNTLWDLCVASGRRCHSIGALYDSKESAFVLFDPNHGMSIPFPEFDENAVSRSSLEQSHPFFLFMNAFDTYEIISMTRLLNYNSIAIDKSHSLGTPLDVLPYEQDIYSKIYTTLWANGKIITKVLMSSY